MKTKKIPKRIWFKKILSLKSKKYISSVCGKLEKSEILRKLYCFEKSNIISENVSDKYLIFIEMTFSKILFLFCRKYQCYKNIIIVVNIVVVKYMDNVIFKYNRQLYKHSL